MVKRSLQTAYVALVVLCGVAIWFVHGTAARAFATSSLALFAAVVLYVIWRPKR